MKAITHTKHVYARLFADRAAPHSPPSIRQMRERADQLRLLLWIVLALAGIYLLASHPAWAAEVDVGGRTANFTLFDALDSKAKTQSNEKWFPKISELVLNTFKILAAIEICWAAAIWAFEKDNLNSLAVEFIKKIMFIGFFYALLLHAPEWIPAIVDSFESAGKKAADIKDEVLSTDRIIATGLALINFVWSKAPTSLFGILGALGKIIVACFVTIGIVIAFVVIAAQYFTLKIESYILFAAGAIFLGLGSSSWTKDYVSKYLNYAINVGVRLLVLILILSLTLDVVKDSTDEFSFEYADLLELLAVSILQTILAIKAPEMAGALLNGGVGLSAGAAKGAASSTFSTMKMATGAATAATGMAAGALKSAASAGISAAQGMGNMGKAVSAGRDMAKQEGKSGAAATLSGLGKAAGQVGQEVANSAKAVPGKLLDAIKGKTEHGANPGLFDRAKQNLQGHAAEGAPKQETGSSAEQSTKDAAATPAGNHTSKGGGDSAGDSKQSSPGLASAGQEHRPATAEASPARERASNPSADGGAASPKAADASRPPPLKKGSTAALGPRPPENKI